MHLFQTATAGVAFNLAINAISYSAVVVSLWRMDPSEIRSANPAGDAGARAGEPEGGDRPAGHAGQLGRTRLGVGERYEDRPERQEPSLSG